MRSENAKNDLKNKIQGVKREMIIADVVVIILGLIIVIAPETSSIIICRIAGVAFCLMGLERIISYFLPSNDIVLGSFSLTGGVILLGLGIYFLVRPRSLSSFITVILSIVLIVTGIMKIQCGVDFKRIFISRWWIEIVGGVIMVCLGALAFINPFSATKSLMIYIGISMIVSGVWDIGSIIWLTRIVKKMKNDNYYPRADEDDIPTVDE